MKIKTKHCWILMNQKTGETINKDIPCDAMPRTFTTREAARRYRQSFRYYDFKPTKVTQVKKEQT